MLVTIIDTVPTAIYALNSAPTSMTARAVHVLIVPYFPESLYVEVLYNSLKKKYEFRCGGGKTGL